MPQTAGWFDLGIIVLSRERHAVGGEDHRYAMSLVGKMGSQSRLNSQDDTELAERLKRRDPQAMADLYDRYGRTTYSLIFRIVRNASAAEDLVQETFLRIWNRVRAFDSERGALGAWMLTVARNRALDYVRSVDGRMSQNASQLEEMENPSAFTDIEQDILNIDRVRMLKDAFTKLNPKQREVIEMAYYEGLSQTEIGGADAAAAGNRESLGAQRAQSSSRPARAGGHMNTCQQFAEMYELYALGVLDGDEKSELERHLDTGCAACAVGNKASRSIHVVSCSRAGTSRCSRPPARSRSGERWREKAQLEMECCLGNRDGRAGDRHGMAGRAESRGGPRAGDRSR